MKMKCTRKLLNYKISPFLSILTLFIVIKIERCFLIATAKKVNHCDAAQRIEIAREFQ